ncbi:hypothetical protein NP277_03345, partial [Salmonella enterica]|nr:hypothetical protein [Salmonella enterica]MCQ8014917.1 hypothetical protein [Salmonella enterica]
ADRNRSHWSTSKTPSYTKSVSWQHHRGSRSHYVNDANLTQILYLIRRDLKALGINDLFITIPRQGLKVNSDITIIATDSETKGRKKQIVRQTIAALTTVFSVTLGSLMYLHIH